MDGLCQLIARMQDVFKVLRVLAFVGAGFFVATWAWEFISKGEVKLEDVKKRGVGLLVGFVMLFVIGLVLSAVISVGNGGNVAGISCSDILVGGWN